jgi:hypothetical protein
VNLILKIAGGVFLGIAAAYGLYMALNIWERHVIAKRLVEQEKSAVIAQQARISKAVGNLSLLKPTKLFDLCGPPLDDKMQGRPPMRNIYYTGMDKHSVALEFFENQSISFQSFHYFQYEGMTQADMYHSPKNYERDESQIAELPCLIGLADGDE